LGTFSLKKEKGIGILAFLEKGSGLLAFLEKGIGVFSFLGGLKILEHIEVRG
jgi:hypothetical protein